LEMLLPTSLLVLAASYLVNAAPSAGSQTALFNCLKNKGYNLETVSNANYASDSAAFNRRLSFQPVALVFPLSAQNVSDIVHCASSNSFKVTARSGGHSYAAYGLGGQNGNVIVDLRHLTEITLNADNTVVSGAGNRLGALATGIYNQGKRGLPHGTCPYVGSGGHTSFGGFGLASRKYGLLLDTVVSAQVVLANGTLITASSTQNTDIFFAIRGSAPSFGIVTSWTYATIPAQDSIGFTINWGRTLSQAEFVTAYQAYQNFSQTAPSDLGFDGDISGGQGSPIALSFLGFWYGSASTFNSTLAPFLSKLPSGYQFSPKTYSWIDGLKFLSGDNSLDTTQPDGTDTFFVKSLQTKGPHTTASLQSFTNFLYTKGVNADTNWFIGFDLYGGGNSKISQIASSATAYANRDAFITYQFYASSGSSSFPSDGISFITSMLNSLETNVQAAYPNYVDPTLTSAQWKAQYYGSNYARLLSLKQSVDPNNVFDYPQAIGHA